MKTRIGMMFCCIGTVLAAGVLTGCGRGEAPADADEDDGEIDLSFNCNESRGNLATYDMMVSGAWRKTRENLESGAPYIVKLAEERGADADVLQHLDAWKQAIQARKDAVRAIPPVISNGQFVEPDTTQIDQQLIDAVKPHQEALREYVKEKCGDAG